MNTTITEKNFTEEKLFEVNPNQSKYSYLLENNQKHMDLIAISFENRKITYEEMHENINKYANALGKIGIKSGDIVGVCLLNTPESVYILYALDILRATVVGFDPYKNELRIREDIALTNPNCIISINPVGQIFENLKEEFGFKTILHSLSALQPFDSYNLAEMANKTNDNVHIDTEYFPGFISDIMFTGGSTGINKGVDLDGAGLNFVVESSKKAYDFYPGMVYLGNIPIGHMCFGRAVLHMSLCNNLEFALTLKAMPEEFYEEIIRTHANCAAGGPPHWTSLLSKDENGFIVNSKVKKDSLTFLKYAGSGGEALKPDENNAINNALKYAGSNTSLGNGYGATEAWSCMILNTGLKNTPGTLGNKMSCLNFKIVNPETFEEVEKGESGLLLASGKSIMLGYHNNAKETEKVLTVASDGTTWFNTGDIVCELQNGEYKYTGRIKRNFVCGVENIYPEVLESLLVQIPEISEVVVTKVSDDEKQFIPRLTVSVNDFDFSPKELEQKIRSLISTRLSSNWLPGDGKGFVEFTTQPLKRMANSKVDINYYQQRTDEFFKRRNG